jgi:DNA-binding NtrC family response regulator
MPGSPTALVVDDDESLTQIVAMILRMEGFEVQTAHNGVDGYCTYFRNPTDWVVSDIQMPELDGLGMMQCIRARNPRVKTIYMSGEVDKFRAVLKQEAQEFGVKVLTKPFSRHSLIEYISDTRSVDSPGV